MVLFMDFKFCQKILGCGLNKAQRNSNWELRPLSQNQVCFYYHPYLTSCFCKQFCRVFMSAKTLFLEFLKIWTLLGLY
jgi:hypothetical protein